MAGPRRRLRIACLLLVMLGAGLTVFLLSCPRKPGPSASAPASAPAARPSPSPEQRAPAAAPEPPAPLATAPVPPTAAPPLAAPAPERPRVVGRLAIVIDDAGYDLAELEPFLRLPIALSVAVLPNLPYSAEAARRVRAAGKELLLHLPMEPSGGENPGPGALVTGMSEAEIERLVDEALASVPGAVGVNNHMGSRATADPAMMRTLMGILKRRGLYYLDSRTTADTLGETLGRQLGVPVLARRVFLDAESGDGAIEQALGKAVAMAARDGESVAIGHVQTPGLVGILARAPVEMRQAGVGAAGVGELARAAGSGGSAR